MSDREILRSFAIALDALPDEFNIDTLYNTLNALNINTEIVNLFSLVNQFFIKYDPSKNAYVVCHRPIYWR